MEDSVKPIVFREDIDYLISCLSRTSENLDDALEKLYRLGFIDDRKTFNGKIGEVEDIRNRIALHAVDIVESLNLLKDLKKQNTP